MIKVDYLLAIVIAGHDEMHFNYIECLERVLFHVLFSTVYKRGRIPNCVGCNEITFKNVNFCDKLMISRFI